MIPLQNDRNISLLSTLPRLVSTSVVIDSSAGSAFIKRKNGAPIDPVGINLTATTTVFTAPTYTWYYANSTAQGTWIAVGTNSNLLSITSSNFLTHLGTGVNVTYKVVVTQTGFMTAETVSTISYAVEQDETVVVEVLRDNTSIPSAADGTGVVLTNTGNILRVKRGTTYLSYAATGANTWSVSTTVSPAGGVTLGTLDTTTDPTKAEYANLTAMSAATDTATVTYTIVVRDASGNSLPPITRVHVYSKSKAGVLGADSISVILSNEAHVFPASTAGVVSSYVGSGTEIRVYQGATELQYDGTGTANGTWKVAVQANDNVNITVGGISDSGSYATVADHSGVASGTDTSSIKYTITGKSSSGTSFTATKNQVFSKTKNGTNPVIYSIVTSAPVITKAAPDAATSGVHSSISIQGKKYEGTVTTNYGWVTVTPNGGTESSTATDTASTPVTLAPANGDGKSSYTIKMYNQATVSGATLLDTKTVSIVFKGATGATGDPGSTGSTGAATFIVYAKNNSNLTAPSGITGGVTTTTNGAAPSGWSTTVPTLDDTNFVQWQSDGTQPAGSTTTTWGTPYLSYFKVAKLSAITTETGTLTIGTTGNLKGGKSTYSDTTAGFWMGYDSAKYKFKIGDNSSSLDWDGSTVTVKGKGTFIDPSAPNNRLELGTSSDASNGAVLKVTRTAATTLPPSYVYDTATGALQSMWISHNGGPGLRIDSSDTALSLLSLNSTSTAELLKFTSDRNSAALYVVNTSDQSSGHAIRAYTQYAGGAGQVSAIVGAASGYSFYAETAFTTGTGSNLGYGPFTGCHDGLITKTYNPELGDILSETGIISKNGVSDVIGSLKPAVFGEFAIGIFVIKKPLTFDWVPSALIDTTKTEIVSRNPDDPTTKYVKTYPIDGYDQLMEIYDWVGVNSVGEGQVNVCGENGNIQIGDLIVTSSIPGKGMKQSDDIIRSYTVARARESAIFNSPTEIKQIACIYLCG